MFALLISLIQKYQFMQYYFAQNLKLIQIILLIIHRVDFSF
jgi:hypothetical protein